MSKFRVGAGIASLDFPLEQYPAMTFSAVCEDKYDDCNCRAIAIECGSKRVLLLAFELSDIPEVPDLEKKVAQAVGYDENDIVITVTHNHTSPCDRGARGSSDADRMVFREKFFQVEQESAISAAKAAVDSLRPAKYGYGQINSYINANELTRDPEIGWLCDEATNGYTDHTLAVLKFVDENDQLVCVLMNHPCHATCAMELDANGKYATSGNFTGITSRFLEDYYGNGVVAAWTSGAAGNMHPILNGTLVYPYTDGYVMQPQLPPGTGHMMMEHVGRQHAVDAINCIDRIRDYSDDMELSHVKGSVQIPTQKNLDIDELGMMMRRRQDYGRGVRSNQPKPAPAFREPRIVDTPECPAELKMEVLKLGDTAIVGLGCELFCQIGRDIKAAIPAKNTIVITHTPGYVGDNPHAVGYIVDRGSLGSHNIKLYRNLKPGCYDEMIVEKAKELYEKANCP